MNNIHTFAICAYKESPYLEECIKSVLNQKIKSKCVVCTSTPNHYIEKISKDVKFGKIYTTIHMTSGIDYQIDNEYYFKLEQLLNPLVINTMNQI